MTDMREAIETTGGLQCMADMRGTIEMTGEAYSACLMTVLMSPYHDMHLCERTVHGTVVWCVTDSIGHGVCGHAVSPLRFHAHVRLGDP